ncbi:Patatin-like phospholipase [compost metagenome]
MSKLGLVLSGGGARGAYQAGALTAIAEISRELGIENPFQIYSGISSGAINISFLAAHPEGFIPGCQHITERWSNITSPEVFVSDFLSLSRIGLNWMSELSLGGMKPHTPGLSLLNTAPLRAYLQKHCNFDQIQKNIDAQLFEAVAVSAMGYEHTNTVTFIQSSNNVKPWSRARRRSENTLIKVDHVLASSSLPLLFPPVKIDDSYFGDGCIRNQAPCGPAIYMGADRLIAIGVRKRQDTCYSPLLPKKKIEAPSVARMANVLLHAVMMDGMELDIERIERINMGIQKISATEVKNLGVRHIDCLWISPSSEMSEMALKKADQLPRMIRYLIRGLGNMDEAAELISFLLFDPSYCQQLIEMGFRDGMMEREKIIRLLDPERTPKNAPSIEKHL